jgi:hypothetical protein
MKNTLAKILSINPLCSLVLVISYIAFLWYVTATIWVNDHKVGAVVFVLVISLVVRSKSTGLIDELKLIKSEKAKQPR